MPILLSKIPYNKEKLCENGGITTVDLRDGPGSDPYRCQCSFGFTGENCKQELSKFVKNLDAAQFVHIFATYFLP